MSRGIRGCQENFQADWTAMINLAAVPVRKHNLDWKCLRLALVEISLRRRCLHQLGFKDLTHLPVRETPIS